MTYAQLPKNVRIFASRFDEDKGGGAIEETRYDLTRLPGGEIGVRVTGVDVSDSVPAIVSKLIKDQAGRVFLANVKSSDDVMALVLLRDAVGRMGERFGRDVLVMPYVPYGRQDRVCSDGEAFSLKAFADIVNGMGFSAVVSFDPHSLVTNALIDRFLPIDLVDLLPDAWNPKPGYVVAPDAGASFRANKAALKLGRPLLQALKRRHEDRVMSCVLDTIPCELSCLVVDDICDGGATFLALAEELKRKGAGELSLLVTHGIFSNGLDALAERYERIYCVNNISGLEHPQLEVLA